MQEQKKFFLQISVSKFSISEIVTGNRNSKLKFRIRVPILSLDFRIRVSISSLDFQVSNWSFELRFRKSKSKLEFELRLRVSIFIFDFEFQVSDVETLNELEIRYWNSKQALS